MWLRFGRQRYLMGKLLEEFPPGTARRRWEWIELAQDRVQWQALVLAVLNLRVLLPELVN